MSSPQPCSRPSLEELKIRLGEIYDLQRASAVLSWDQQTYMPKGGAAARGEQRATLSGLIHQRSTDPRLGELIARLEEENSPLDPEQDDHAMVRMARRTYERNRRIPEELIRQLTLKTSLAREAWVEARAASVPGRSLFGHFAPYLTEVVRLKREQSEALGYPESPYDAHLDYFEPGLLASQAAILLDRLAEGLRPLVEAITASSIQIETTFLEDVRDGEKQWAISLEILQAIGYDFQRGRQDRSAHPFTTAFSGGDVRITNRLSSRLETPLFTALHEGGHALYHFGIPCRLERSNLASGSSYGLHESQSRLWENLVGGSRPFWAFWFPRLAKAFPERLATVSEDSFYRAVNAVRPSPIRVEADEVTYNLHIVLRFQLEQALLEGRLAVKDLPSAWNEGMVRLLGVMPRDDAEGVLQDVHWSSGQFGYFPSYALGNLLAVQFFNCALHDLPGLNSSGSTGGLIARGEYAPLRQWLHDRIHSWGGKLLPDELVRKVIGGPIDSQPFLDYLWDKYAPLYGLQRPPAKRSGLKISHLGGE
ncbi:MAG: carboxypeptidase M32 [bacterium]